MSIFSDYSEASASEFNSFKSEHILMINPPSLPIVNENYCPEGIH
jgi:hypothetical protein